MIAQYKEQHYSFTEVKDFINDRRMRLGCEEDDAVTRSAVYSAYKKMVKIVTPINKRAQGNSDRNSPCDVRQTVPGGQFVEVRSLQTEQEDGHGIMGAII